jgi:cell division protein FtsB
LLKQVRAKIIIVVVILSGIYFFIFSKSGLLERIQQERRIKNLEKRIEVLKERNSTLVERLKKYREHGSDEDLHNSGFVRDGDTIIRFRGIGKDKPKGAQIEEEYSDFSIGLRYLRIGWLILATILIGALLYFGWKQRGREET